MKARMIVIVMAALALSACATASTDKGMKGGMHAHPPGGEYRQVSELVALPEFIPGLGRLYVQPETLPAGPFLAYDKSDTLVSTIYMIPLDDLNANKAFKGLETPGRKTVSVDLYYNAGHPGVEEPHYHVVLWHVDPDRARLE
jgi:hypothetical protein